MTTEPIRRLRILSVEDEELNRALVRASLRSTAAPALADAELTEVTTLAEARAAVATSAFDLILLDRRLPDGDGFELARLLAGDTRRPRILALTADAVPATMTAATAAGCDAVLTKPYRPGELVSVMRDLTAG